MLRDIAILTGGEVITSELGLELKDATVAQLGRARQVKVTKENTIIVDGAGEKSAIADRVAQIRSALEVTTSEFDKEKLLERLAKLAGGGTAFVNVIDAVEKAVATLEGDEKTGAQIVARALTAPMKQIAENAGLDGAVIIAKVRESGKIGYGFDAYKEEYCDMVASGIVDPAKVTRSALQNAVSIAATVLTTEAVVAEKKEEKPAAPAAPAGMDGMY